MSSIRAITLDARGGIHVPIVLSVAPTFTEASGGYVAGIPALVARR
jgi:hypothetical protein